jgi:hypothetical protein
MKKRGFIIILVMVFVLAGFKPARAEIQITDNLSVAGFLRYELGVHIGGRSPYNTNQEDNNVFTLSRTFLVTEWTYEPTDNFKLYTKARFIEDQTSGLDDNLNSYDAFPVDVSKNDWTLMEADGDHYQADIWELYGDLKIGDLWLRLGRQQIVWGEMISTRILDIINPLDKSWNMKFEPEEFENIRIPNWAIRGSYLLKQPFLDELSVEGFINPGDILPDQNPGPGSPFYSGSLGDFPPFIRLNEKDRRNNVEYGFRLGYQIKRVYGTLCYLHLYDDFFKLETTGIIPNPPGPPTILLDVEYQSMDIYGMTLNYDLAYPYNMVFSYEGAWIPNQPYQDRQSYLNGSYKIRDLGTFKWAFRIDRPTAVFPPRFMGADFQYMKVTLQFSQTIREGDADTVSEVNKIGENARIDQTDEMIVFKVAQPFSHNNWEPSFQLVYDLDDAYMIKPGIKYVHGDHWYFDLYGVIIGGAETRKSPDRFGWLDFANEIFGRITYQF